MPWINGRWRPEGWQTSGQVGEWDPAPGMYPGLLGDVGRGGKAGDLPAPNPWQPPIYDRGPQMQPPMFGNIPPQWDPAPPQWDPAPPPLAYQPHTPWQSGLAPRQPWSPPPVQPQVRQPAPQIQGPPIPPRMVAPPQVEYQPPGLRPTIPPPPTIDPIRPPMPPPQYPVINPEGGWADDLVINPGGGWPPQPPPPPIYEPPRPPTDHEFNVQQREKTKVRLANERSITKAHYAKLREKGVSAKTIAKAKTKAQARYAKIEGQSLRRHTTSSKNGKSK